MNFHQSHFSVKSFSNEERAMTNQFHSEKYLVTADGSEQKSCSNVNLCEQVTAVSKKQFSFLWTITNFKEFMDRQYEFTSPVFFGNVSSGVSKWKMVVHPENLYPEGVHVALKILMLSEVDGSYPVMYTVSFIDKSGTQHKLKTREKVFRHILDFDDCSIISNINLEDKKLFSGNSLVIKCELDLLECENRDEIICKSSGSSLKMSTENLDSFASKSFQVSDSINYQEEKNNIPSVIQRLNDLSYSEPLKKLSDGEKEVNTFTERENSMEPTSVRLSNCKMKELEMLSNDLKHLYHNTKQHDVVIYPDNGKLTAHEIILTSRSDYFKNELIQKNKELDIPGVSMETLDAVLFYLYTGKLKQMTESSALDLVKASKLFGLVGLENMTTEMFLCPRIRANNVTNIFLMAKELKIESLKTKALKFIAENRDEVTKTEQWNDLMRKDPHSAGEIFLTIAYYENKVPDNASNI